MEKEQKVKTMLRAMVEEMMQASKNDVQRTQKNVLSTAETAEYLGISKSTLYKMMMNRILPYYKPTGKKCFFKLEEIEAWLTQNRHSTAEELSQQAQNLCTRKGGRQ